MPAVSNEALMVSSHADDTKLLLTVMTIFAQSLNDRLHTDKPSYGAT